MKTWNCLMVLLLALPSAFSFAYSHPGSLLYPYGPAHQDLTTDIEDDGGTESIALSHSFTFFGETHRDCFVNNNGAISFKSPVTEYTPDAFPIDDFCMICPFWGDVDNEYGGMIYYRQTTDTELMEWVSQDINKLFENLDFIANWIFIVTWDNVAYHGSESNKTNTFQCLLVADRFKRCLVMFNYHEIEWTTGTASGGDPDTGLGGTPAQAGFNTGKHYFNMPMSRTEHVVNIKSSSNVGVPGRWIFRVDEFQVPGGCIYKDSFLQYGQTIWSDEKCTNKCVCKHEGNVHCEEKSCDEELVCLPAGHHFLCQINEEDC